MDDVTRTKVTVKDDDKKPAKQHGIDRYVSIVEPRTGEPGEGRAE